MRHLKMLKERAALIQAVRSFFIEQEFLEVETPIRVPAPVPEANIEPETSSGWFLQASPELCMKRLLAQGYSKIFQICKCFRKNERGDLHLPEMTMLEWYRPGTIIDLMDDCQKLFLSINPGPIAIADSKIDLTPPWPRLSLEDAFEQFSSISLKKAMRKGLFEEILVSEVEPCLGLKSPVFLCDYPAVMASLARVDPNNVNIAQRFELYLNGIELANGFTELTDPMEQRKRFEQEIKAITGLNRTPGPMPEKFLEDLDKIPDSAGIALGIDRLIMLLCNVSKIDQVVSFTPEEL